MKRQFFIVANPATGTQQLEHILNELLDYITSGKHTYEVFLTTKSRNAWKTVENHFDASFTDLVVIGGDGTINESVNGLKYDVPVSIIPNGSGNDFVKMLDIGEGLEDHIDVVFNGTVKTTDLGVCNGRKFVNGVGIGFDGKIVRNMQQGKSLLRGPARYYYHVLRILATYRARRYQYVQDKTAREKELILLCVANGSTFGGSFRLTPEAVINDTILDVCEIGKMTALKRFLNIHRLKEGTHDYLKEVRLSRCKHLHLSANPRLHAHIDGEYFGQPPFEIGVLPNALKIRMKN